MLTASINGSACRPTVRSVISCERPFLPGSIYGCSALLTPNVRAQRAAAFGRSAGARGWALTNEPFAQLTTECDYFLSTIKPSQLVLPVFSNECDVTAGRKDTSPRFLTESVDLPSGKWSREVQSESRYETKAECE
jgi:hypothetical protein